MIYVTIVVLILLILSIISYFHTHGSLDKTLKELEKKNKEYWDKKKDIENKIEKTDNPEKKEKLKETKDDIRVIRTQIQTEMENIEIKERRISILLLTSLLCFIICLVVDGNLIYKYSDMSTIQEQIKIYSNEDLKIRNDISYIIETKLENNNINIKKVNNAYTYLIMYPELKKDKEIYKLVDSSQKYQDQILQLKLKYAKLKKYKTILFFK